MTTEKNQTHILTWDYFILQMVSISEFVNMLLSIPVPGSVFFGSQWKQGITARRTEVIATLDKQKTIVYIQKNGKTGNFYESLHYDKFYFFTGTKFNDKLKKNKRTF